MPDSGSRGSPKLPPTQRLNWLDRRAPMLRLERIPFLLEQAKLGDISTFMMGPTRVYFINHPDLIRDVLVVNADKFVKGRALRRAKRLLGSGLLTSEAAFHLRQRRMIQPAFHKARIAEYARSMTQFADEIAAGWQDGATLDVDQEMMRLTLRIVGKTLFDADVTGDADEVGKAMSTMIGMFNFLLLPFSEYLEKLPFPHNIRFNRARKTLDGIIYSMINARRNSGGDRGDLLSMLLLAQDEDDGSVMTDEQVRDEVMTLFLAGHETTANALTWTWYLLSQNPAAENKLHSELAYVLDGRVPKLDDMARLSYSESVLAESMRLYPPAWAIGRTAITDHDLGGYPIPPGSTVLSSQYILHRDTRFWDDPDSFIPERWETQTVKEAGQKGVYFPFGGGVRRCIGEGFAWTEGVLALATIARKWKLRLDRHQQVGLKPLITLRPKYGMRMSVHSLL